MKAGARAVLESLGYVRGIVRGGTIAIAIVLLDCGWPINFFFVISLYPHKQHVAHLFAHLGVKIYGVLF